MGKVDVDLHGRLEEADIRLFLQGYGEPLPFVWCIPYIPSLPSGCPFPADADPVAGSDLDLLPGGCSKLYGGYSGSNYRADCAPNTSVLVKVSHPSTRPTTCLSEQTSLPSRGNHIQALLLPSPMGMILTPRGLRSTWGRVPATSLSTRLPSSPSLYRWDLGNTTPIHSPSSPIASIHR